MSEQVFRVEDENGDGPYVSRSGYTDVGPGTEKRLEYGKKFDDDGNMERPPPRLDGLPRIPGDYGREDFMFGFESEEMLRRWFDECRRAWLRSHGYRLVRYCTELALKGLHQLAFLKQSKKLSEEEL